MSTQFTPGPWTVGKSEISGKLYVDCGGSLPVIVVVDQYHQAHEANAQLIAAAPDMLKELEGCLRVAKAHYLDMVDQYTDDDPDIEEHLRHAHPNIAAAAMEVKRIETIIRKATGNI